MNEDIDGVQILYWAKTLNQAQVLQTTFEAYGFHPFIADAGHAGFGMFGAPFKGGIRLFVPTHELDDAQKLLQSLVESESDGSKNGC